MASDLLTRVATGGVMTTKQLIEARQQAVQAVAEMPDGDLKIRAFEVVLTHLLGSSTSTSSDTRKKPRGFAKCKEKRRG